VTASKSIEDGEDLNRQSNVVDDEKRGQARRRGHRNVSKKWLRVCGPHGVEIREGEDESLLLALTVAVEEMSRRCR